MYMNIIGWTVVYKMCSVFVGESGGDFTLYITSHV